MNINIPRNILALACWVLASLIVTTDASSYVDGGQDIACWRAKVMVDCDTFPGVDITVDWTPFKGRLVEGDVINVPSLLILPATLNISTQLFKAHEYSIDHTNIHACLTNGGFCSPFVAQSPSLVTHSEALKGMPMKDVTFSITLEQGTWTFITHYRIFIDNNIRIDFAKGHVAVVEPLRLETVAEPAIVTISVVFSIIGTVVSLLFLIGSYHWRNTNVFKLASWKFCAISAFGGVLGNLCILLWVPPLSNLTCMLRPLIIPVAFDFLYFPLLLKTWRLKVLLVDSAQKLKRISVSDSMLYKWLALPVCIDLMLAIVWILISVPIPTVVESLISVSRFEMYCSSLLSLPFLVVFFLIKVPPLIWGLSLSWSTRTIISEMNESSHILLSMINMFFVLCYVCVIQFLITDSQSALVMLRSLGTFVAATFTLIIVLGPKAAQLLMQGDIPSLKASIQKRQSSQKYASRLSNSTSSTVRGSVVDAEVGKEVP